MNINSKDSKKRSFSYETKASIFLSEQGECVYDASSWKERRLLLESMFIPIDRWNLILKTGMKQSFSYETKASIHLSQRRE